MCHMSNVFAINLRSQFPKEMKKICIHWYYNRSHLNYVAMKPPFNPLPKKHCFTAKNKKKKSPFNHLHHIPSKSAATADAFLLQIWQKLSHPLLLSFYQNFPNLSQSI